MFVLNCSLFLISFRIFVTLTVFKIFDFFDFFLEITFKILKILYLGYFWDFSNQKKLKIFLLDRSFFLLSCIISVTLTVFEIFNFFENFYKFSFMVVFLWVSGAGQHSKHFWSPAKFL